MAPSAFSTGGKYTISYRLYEKKPKLINRQSINTTETFNTPGVLKGIMPDPSILGDILMVEDNPGDVRLTKEMFEEEGLNPTFHVVYESDDVLDFIHKRGEYANVPTPDIILLDWHLPTTNGGEILAEINDSDDLGDIPVVVQSGSGSEIDAIKEQGPSADGYITKPFHPDDLADVLGDV